MSYTWSFSALKQFINCPKQYHAIKILKNYEQKVSESMKYGTEVHKALEDYVTLNKTKVEEISDSEIKISNPLYDLGNVRYTKKIDEDGNSIMLVEDVIAPDNEMSSNIEPIVRRLVRYSSDLGFDGLAFKPGQNFDGPKQTFFNETIPDVIRDVTSSIDKSAGPTVTNINGEAHNSIDITNKVKAASTRIN